MHHATELLTDIPQYLDRRFSAASIAVLVSLFLSLILLPTGVLDGNEEFYFQTATAFWESEPRSTFSAIQERSEYLFLSGIVIGLPTMWFGFEVANALLRILTAVALAIGFANLAAAWRLSALDSLLAISIFILCGQEFFGGEWIFQFVEGKVFAYACVFLGLSQAFNGKWKGSVAALIIATYFHFLVGGFWMAVALIWLLTSGNRIQRVAHVALVYAIAVLPLVALILWHRFNGAPVGSSVDTWYIYAVLRMPHHIAPFSNHNLIWNWTPGIAALVGTLLASLLVFKLDLDAAGKRLIRLVIGLQAFLLLALLVSASEFGARSFGEFYLFRPSSLILLLTVVSALAAYRQLDVARMPIWILAWVLIPIVSWGAFKSKVEEMLVTDVQPAEINDLVDAVTGITSPADVVLIQPGRDGQQPEVRLERLLQRPTLVNWKFVPTVPSNIASWYQKGQFRTDLFENGCGSPMQYPVGALIVRNELGISDVVLRTCGPAIWHGATYSVIDVR